MSYKGYFLVRDKNGKPKFDDISQIHEAYWEQLTDLEKQTIKQERKNGSHS